MNVVSGNSVHVDGSEKGLALNILFPRKRTYILFRFTLGCLERRTTLEEIIRKTFHITRLIYHSFNKLMKSS
mgnify:CR=1 FL=1